MPPWFADDAHSLKFRNDARLRDSEIGTLLSWVDADAPPDAAANSSVPVPAVPEPASKAPDALVSLSEFHAPATGEIPYVQRRVKVPFDTDKWIAAIQVQPGNSALVHHMAITEVALADGVRAEDLDSLANMAKQMGFLESAFQTLRPAVEDPRNPGAYDMLGVYTPGTTIETFDEDSGKLLKGGKNLYLNVNIHYTATGKAESDQSKIAFWFRNTPPGHQLLREPAAGKTILANGVELFTDEPGTKAEGTDFAIPPIKPYMSRYELVGMTAYTYPVTIYQLQPHAHMRAIDFKYEVVYPDGSQTTVLAVPKYDFHWQLAYDLKAPLHLPAGSKLIVTAHYDNSIQNKRLLDKTEDPSGNCGPDKAAYFRNQNQSWDEMFSPFIQYSVDEPRGPAATSPASAKKGHLKMVWGIGCLARKGGIWTLDNASKVVVSDHQSTSHAELSTATHQPLGDSRYELLGIEPYEGALHEHAKVAVKGILIGKPQHYALNVTSLQSFSAGCPTE